MNLIFVLLLGLLFYAVVRTHLSVRRCRGAQERSAAIRFAAFSWILGIMAFAMLFLPIPGKHRLLMILPVIFIGTVVSKVLRNARARIRQEEQLEVDIERMKRVN